MVALWFCLIYDTGSLLSNAPANLCFSGAVLLEEIGLKHSPDICNVCSACLLVDGINV